MSFESEDRLEVITLMIDNAIEKLDMLTSTRNFLLDVQFIANADSTYEQTERNQLKIIISTSSFYCDISNRSNKTISVAKLVEQPNKQSQISSYMVPLKNPPTSPEEIEYDAIYEALTSFFNVCIVDPKAPVEIHNSNYFVVCTLNNKIDCRNEECTRKRDNILELVERLPTGISFKWRPIRSTKAMKNVSKIATETFMEWTNA